MKTNQNYLRYKAMYNNILFIIYEKFDCILLINKTCNDDFNFFPLLTTWYASESPRLND